MIRLSPAAAIMTATATAGSAALAAYALCRPALHRWGATPQEVARQLPGDSLIEHPNLTFTLAITINAPPEAVWPWIVQLGQGRGGWYSYDWLENLLGLDIHTADRILPAFQHLAPGDVIPTGAVDIPVLAVAPARVLLLGGAEYATIAFVLEPLPGGQTRLIFRNRAHIARSPSGLFWLALMDPGIFVMSRKMLLTIKARAEHGSPGTRRAHRPWFNRVVLPIAGRPGSPFARIEHVGRRSGRVYHTPVEALPTGDGFVIALGQGPGCDWCRNVLAARGCTVVHDGTAHRLADPEVIQFAAAAPLLSPLRRWLYRRSGARHFLRLRRPAHGAPAPAAEQAALVTA